MSRKPKDSAAADAPDFRLEDFLPYRLSVAATQVSRLFAKRYAHSFGLSIPEWRVLAVVGRHATLSPSAVGEATAMDKVKVSRAAASLVVSGLVKQAQDPSDGRGRLLSLTRKGQSVYANMVPVARETEERVAAGLSKAEWAMLYKTLAKLTSHLAGIEADGSSDAD